MKKIPLKYRSQDISRGPSEGLFRSHLKSLSRRSFLKLLGGFAGGFAAKCAFAAASTGLLGAVFGLSACSSEKRSVLRVGTKIDVPNFGYQDPDLGEITGFEVDIAREIAYRLYGSQDAIEITGVNVTTRGAMLDTGVLDASLATFTITEARRRSYNFTDPYYQDFIGILVKQASGIESFEDLDGKTIGVAQAATTRAKLEELAAEKNIHLEFAEYATYPEIKIALVTGRVAAFSVDKSILKGYLDEGTYLLDTELGKQDYGIATSKHDQAFSDSINQTLNEMREDGTLDALKEKWGLS